MWIGLSDETLKMFAKPKALVPLRRRDKRYKSIIRRKERFHTFKVQLAFDEYYKDAEF